MTKATRNDLRGGGARLDSIKERLNTKPKQEIKLNLTLPPRHGDKGVFLNRVRAFAGESIARLYEGYMNTAKICLREGQTTNVEHPKTPYQIRHDEAKARLAKAVKDTYMQSIDEFAQRFTRLNYKKDTVERNEEIEVVNREYQQGYEVLRSELEQAVSGKKIEEFTRNPRSNGNEIVELEKMTEKAKATTLSIMTKMGFQDDVKRILQEPDSMTTRFVMGNNGPTVLSSFLREGNQYEISFYFRAAWGEDPTQRKIQYINLNSKGAKIGTLMWVDKDTFNVKSLDVCQVEKEPLSDKEMSSRLNINEQNIMVDSKRNEKNRFKMWNEKGFQSFSGEYGTFPPAGRKNEELKRVLASVEPQALAGVIRNLQTVDVDWSNDSWLLTLKEQMPIRVQQLLTDKNIA